MNIGDLKALIMLMEGDFAILFKIGDDGNSIKFNQIDVSYSTKEVVFRDEAPSYIEINRGMNVASVLSIIANLNPSWTISFEDKEDPSETFTIDCAEVKLDARKIILKHWAC